MEANQCLIAQAYFRAGANIHHLNNVVNAYIMAIRVYNKSGRPEYLAKIEDIERKLRKFIYTGELEY